MGLERKFVSLGWNFEFWWEILQLNNLDFSSLGKITFRAVVQNKPEKKAERNWSQVFSRFQKIVVFKIKIEFTFRYSKPFFGPCDYCNRQNPFFASAHKQILLQIPFKNRINNKRTGLEARFLISPRLHVNSQRYNNLYMKVVRKWTYQFSPSSPWDEWDGT